MLNKVMLIGNLGSDPETRRMQDGTCVCNINIATTEQWTDKSGQKQERTEWHRIELWRRLGEIAEQYLRKGSRVYIEGSIYTDKWTDQSGNNRYTTKIRAREMKMLTPRGEGGFQQGPPQQQQQQQNQNNNNFPTHGGGGGAPSNNQPPPQQNQDPFADTPDFNNVPTDDDLPF